jgi:Na+/H+-translocating membrane pyrophosphatase
MMLSVRANVRATAAALVSYDLCLKTCFRAGAFNGMMIPILSLFGVTSCYSLVRSLFDLSVSQAPTLLVAFGFGASLVALFAQLGGGEDIDDYVCCLPLLTILPLVLPATNQVSTPRQLMLEPIW